MRKNTMTVWSKPLQLLALPVAIGSLITLGAALTSTYAKASDLDSVEVRLRAIEASQARIEGNLSILVTQKRDIKSCGY